MQLDVVDIQGKKVGALEVADAVFAAPVKEHLFWEVVKAQRAARRAGTHATKTRMHVRGGGKKPYRQKGTGNARQGSSRFAPVRRRRQGLRSSTRATTNTPSQEGPAGGPGLGPLPAGQGKEGGHRLRILHRCPQDQEDEGVLKALGASSDWLSTAGQRRFDQIGAESRPVEVLAPRVECLRHPPLSRPRDHARRGQGGREPGSGRGREAEPTKPE